MSVSIELLQELPAQEGTSLGPADCCWDSTQWINCTVGLTDTCSVSFLITTCHSCTNTNS